MGFRSRWALFAVLAVIPFVGAGAGMLAAASKPPVYSAEARLAMGRADLVDVNTEAQAANYARFVTKEAVLAVLPAGSVLDVSASPIPDSNIIRVEAKATDSPMAVEAAGQATKLLQTKVNSLAGEAKAKETYRQLQRVSRQVATYQSQANQANGSGAAYIDAQAQLTSTQAQQAALSSLYQDQAKNAVNANMTLLSKATATGDDVSSRKQIYLLAGFGIGALLAYVIGRIVVDIPWRRRAARPATRSSARTPRSVADYADEPEHALNGPNFPNAQNPPNARNTQSRSTSRAPAPVLTVPDTLMAFDPVEFDPERPVEARVERPVDRLAIFDRPADTRAQAADVHEVDLREEEPSLPPVPVQVPVQLPGPVPVPAQAGGRPQRQARSQHEPVDRPTITLRPQAGGSRRGLNGLRQEPSTPRRTWP